MLSDILVLGLGSSGRAVAEYCAARIGSEFASVSLCDGSDSPELRSAAEALRGLGVAVRLGCDRVSGSFDLCVASPGIPPHAPLMESAKAASAQIVSEIEFAFTRSESAWVAVTGTNGKTTTTALVAHLLNTGGIPARAVGNIGTPAIEAVEDGSHQVLVAEVSSFQLALSKTFHPRVAVLLNITPDHIDWHGSLERYAADKAKVFANLGPDDTAVIDADDPGSAAYISHVAEKGATVVPVSLHGEGAGTARLAGDELIVPGPHGPELVGSVDELQIRGPHNVSNALAAAAAAHALGVSAHDLRVGLRSFSPIEHRLEPVGVVDGVEYFNDSKATNPDAVSKAIGAFGDRRFVLLLGGKNKGNDFRPLARQAAEKASAVVLFGGAAGELAAAFEGLPITAIRVGTMADAVERAADLAAPGDAVVLSPACASFDEFRNYEERGRVFKELVGALGAQAGEPR